MNYLHTKEEKPPEESLPRCAGCGMERHGWTAHDGQGVQINEFSYCCEGCAKASGCDCTHEQARPSGGNIGPDRV